ncbi:MAG: beta-ketoacyl-[acyl-carrier-protein] synthase family protein [Nitrospirota bacterium]|nr:beta-ketoacyl-[acyl-carrier-protein] synthase family protein [Nitrospirota bacterium]
MIERVVITGLGVVSSIGIGQEEFWQGLLSGKSGISPVNSFDATQHFSHNGGEVRNFDPDKYNFRDRQGSMSRATQMAVAAAELAVTDAGLHRDAISERNVSVCIGTTTGSIHIIEMINNYIIRGEAFPPELASQLPTHSTAAEVAGEFGISGNAWMFSTACAAGNYAIGYGYDLIRLGRADMVLVGGSDAFSRISFTGFNQFRAVAPGFCQPFDKNRKGMIPAEGAGVLVLESEESARLRNARVYAEVLGYGLSCDASHMTSPSVDGIVKCMIKAMKQAEIGPGDVDYISAHGTGTLNNDRAECAAIKEVFGERYSAVPVSSIKSMLGHTMGAASALEAIACSLAVAYDMIPPTINYETPDTECDIDCVPNTARRHTVNVALNNSYAFGGNNACVVLNKYMDNTGGKNAG